MYKIIFGYCDINCHHYFDIIGITQTRSKHEYKIKPKVARTNYFKYSFFHRYINDWNSLPSKVMSSPSLQSFKVVKVSLLGYLTFVSKRLSAVGNKRISQFFDSAHALRSRRRGIEKAKATRQRKKQEKKNDIMSV